MKQYRSAEWFRLDNAAKIFPPNSNKKDSKVFRFSCELKEAVDPDLLQQALDLTMEEFPLYHSVMKRGLFWYYLERSSLRPLVAKEALAPCAPLFHKNQRSLLFRVHYYRCRINLEVYHALTDGTGALQFLRALVYHYLLLAHPELAGQEIPREYTASFSQRSADSFQKYYSGKSDAPAEKTVIGERAYRIKGQPNPEHILSVTEGVLSVRQVHQKAQECGTSITVFLLAAFILAIYQEMPLRALPQPVVMSVPVNLRNYFSSGTARNFFGLINVSCRFSQEEPSLEAIIQKVSAAFRQELTAEQLSRRMNDLIALEKNPLIRVLPLSIKNPILRLSSMLSSQGVTSSLSNVGRVSMPEALRPYILQFGLMVSSPTLQACVCSFEDRLVISFTSAFLNPDIRRNFFRLLSSMGLSVELAVNEPTLSPVS